MNSTFDDARLGAALSSRKGPLLRRFWIIILALSVGFLLGAMLVTAWQYSRHASAEAGDQSTTVVSAKSPPATSLVVVVKTDDSGAVSCGAIIASRAVERGLTLHHEGSSGRLSVMECEPVMAGGGLGLGTL